MKTIYQVIGSSVMFPAEVVAETEYSYVGRLNFTISEPSEHCYAKNEEGKKWFWTEDEAKAHVAKVKENAAKLEEFKKQLETYDV